MDYMNVKPKPQLMALALYTNSLRECLTYFNVNKSIIDAVEIHAKTINQTEKELNSEFPIGFTREDLMISNGEFDYVEEVHGPLTNKWINLLIDDMDKHDDDLCVDTILYRFKDPSKELTKKIGYPKKDESEWIFHLETAKPTSGFEVDAFNNYAKINDYNVQNRGFKRMVLNVIEIGSSYDYYNDRKGKYKDRMPYHWWGDTTMSGSLAGPIVCDTPMIQYIRGKIPFLSRKDLDVNQQSKLICSGVT
jgi:hypothetical protein